MILKLKKEIILLIRFKYHMLESQQNIRLIFSPDPDPTYAFNQCCRSGSGSILDPYSEALWIRIRSQNTDPDSLM